MVVANYGNGMTFSGSPAVVQWDACVYEKETNHFTHSLISENISDVKLYVCSGNQQMANRVTTVVSILMTCSHIENKREITFIFHAIS
jgi:hypothetical protein